MSGLGDTVLGTPRRTGTATHMLLLLDDEVRGEDRMSAR